MNVALVYDRVNKWGGAERVLMAMHELWPTAPLFTAVYNKKTASWAHDFDVRPTFLDPFPWARTHHELYPWLTPLAFESFNFDEFDVVISVTSAEAKSIITKPQTTHICYCLTPTRYLWSGYDDYIKTPSMGVGDGVARTMLASMAPTLRRWDRVAASRPDAYIAISRRVAKRIETYYDRAVDRIIYPPVDTQTFSVAGAVKREPFFLLVTRLVGYKRADIVIDAFNTLGLPLVVVGKGWELETLKKRAKPTITFIDQYLTEEELSRYYQRCRALVFAGDEDFGLVAAEAQACGTPVIAYRHSGLEEIVDNGTTGIFFDQQTKESLIQAVKHFDTIDVQASDCRKQAMKFSKKTFQHELMDFVEDIRRKRGV